MKRKFAVITCPICGREYLPAEIYIPKAFFGNPNSIQRDIEGKIIDFDGNTIDSVETFYCEKCNKPFSVNAKILFDTKSNIAIDFDEDYTRKIPHNLIFNEN